MSKTPGSKPISDFPGGAEVVVECLHGGAKSRGRLCALGLTPGTTILVKDSQGQSCRVCVRESELVLGQGLAEQIMAVPCCREPEDSHGS